MQLCNCFSDVKGQVGKNILFSFITHLSCSWREQEQKLGTVYVNAVKSANALETLASPVINFHTCSIHYCADFLPGNGFDWFAIDCDLADVRSLDDTHLNDGGVECIQPARKKRGTTPNLFTFFKPAFSLFPSESSLEKAFLNPFPNISSWVGVFEFRALFFGGTVVNADAE